MGSMKMGSWIRAGAWFFYAVGMVLLFMYLLFPAESLRRFTESTVLEKTGVRLEMKELSLHFPASLHLRDCSLEKDLRIVLEKVRITPSLFAFMKGTPGGDLAVDGLGGSLAAAFRISPSHPFESEGSLHLKNLDMTAVADLSPRPLPFGVKGRLSGRFLALPAEGKLEISGALDMEGADIVLNEPMLASLSLRLVALQLEGRMDARKLDIDNIALSGNFGTLTLRGSISDPMGRSPLLDFSGGIRPDAAFLQQLTRMGGIGPVIGRFVGQREIPVRVAGTLDNPQVSLAGIRL